MYKRQDKFQGVITENGGQIVNSEAWGLKKLAYPIQKKTTGFYFLIEFTGEGSIVNTLETQYRRDERIIRFLTFKQDKFAVEYSCLLYTSNRNFFNPTELIK